MNKARPWITHTAPPKDFELNADTPWSEWAIRDLIACAQHGTSVKETARFLLRTEKEVRAKAKELRIGFLSSRRKGGLPGKY